MAEVQQQAQQQSQPLHHQRLRRRHRANAGMSCAMMTSRRCSCRLRHRRLLLRKHQRQQFKWMTTTTMIAISSGTKNPFDPLVVKNCCFGVLAISFSFFRGAQSATYSLQLRVFDDLWNPSQNSLLSICTRLSLRSLLLVTCFEQSVLRFSSLRDTAISRLILQKRHVFRNSVLQTKRKDPLHLTAEP